MLSWGTVDGLMAVYLRDKRGQHKAPTYLALVNGLLLLVITALVMVEAIDRLLTHNPEVHGLPGACPESRGTSDDDPR